MVVVGARGVEQTILPWLHTCAPTALAGDAPRSTYTSFKPEKNLTRAALCPFAYESKSNQR